MKHVAIFISLFFLRLSSLFSSELVDPTPYHKTVIVGGGIIGALEAYYAHLDAMQKGIKLRVAVYDKSSSFEETASTNTAYNIFPSLTADEILSVVPRGSELVEKLAILFSEPGGIRVDDALRVNDSEAAMQFKEAVNLYGNDQNHDDRTKQLLLLGKMSMDLWQSLYDGADEELKSILEESNYNPCHDPKHTDTKMLHDGYRIDIIYDVPDAETRAEGMRKTYAQLGYTQCRILSPQQVVNIDPSLLDFCEKHSELDNAKTLVWKTGCSALWRPGGCISTRVFLPKFYAYLEKIMGTYNNIVGEPQNYFTLEFKKEVTDVEYEKRSGLSIAHLKFSDGSSEEYNPVYIDSQYVFCPGEAVGTLHKLGFMEPTYAGFAGPSLTLNIPLSAELADKYKNFSHCMEVHKVGIVLAWQARFKDDGIIIGVAGTKAFYGDQLPKIDQEFAKNRHLVQLNMINDVLPEMISLACGYETKGRQLLANDLKTLEDKGILTRWVGRRAVAYDGFPTLGALYCKGRKITNARCTTHLGSGGVSFAPAAIQMSRRCDDINDEFTETILHYADSRRYPEAM